MLHCIIPTIIALRETWLDETITDCDIFVPGFYTIRRDHSRKGGGILLYIKDSVPTPSIIYHASLELLFIEVTLKQGPLNLGLFYRPLSASQDLLELEQFLASLPLQAQKCSSPQ